MTSSSVFTASVACICPNKGSTSDSVDPHTVSSPAAVENRSSFILSASGLEGLASSGCRAEGRQAREDTTRTDRSVSAECVARQSVILLEVSNDMSIKTNNLGGILTVHPSKRVARGQRYDVIWSRNLWCSHNRGSLLTHTNRQTLW